MTVLRRFAALAFGLGIVTTGLLAPAAGRLAPARAGGVPRPNILIIVTDDQRADTLEVMPSVQKWFGREGTSYPNSYVSVPLCCPSRATIMTGRYAHNHGVVDNTAHRNLDQRTTMQYLLHSSGYRTALVGKYFNGWPLHLDPPYFDRWRLFRSGYYGTKWSVDGKVQTIRRYATDYIAKQSVGLLKRFENRDFRPWFLYVAPSAPHEPFAPSPRHVSWPVPEWEPPPSVEEEDKSDKPPAVRDLNADEAGGRSLHDAQLRTLLAVDEMVEKLMQTLGELGEQERTLVFFVGDNGYFWAEHGLTDKRFPYTEAIRVPLLARWPGRLAPGATDQRLVSLVDIAPTVLSAAGVPPDPFNPQDGRSLLDTWQRDRLFIEYFPDSAAGSIGPWASLRYRDIQYVEYYGSDRVTPDFREYYDLQDDPYQLRNLLGDLSPGNDPSPMEQQDLTVQLTRDRSCEGTTGANACP